MKIEKYTFPNSSFLSIEKDLQIIVDQMYKDDRLKNLLYYTSPDALKKTNLTTEQTASLFGKQIRMVPKLLVDSTVLNYIDINFDDFAPNLSNPEFRDNIIEFDIICHYDQWQLENCQLRPYLIAAELDTLFNEKHLTGIGTLHFLHANQMILTDEFGGLCLTYSAIHGEEDKKNAADFTEDAALIENFNKIFNS